MKYKKIQDELDDYESLKVLREAKLKEVEAKTISFDKAKKLLNIKDKTSKSIRFFKRVDKKQCIKSL